MNKSEEIRKLLEQVKDKKLHYKEANQLLNEAMKKNSPDSSLSLPASGNTCSKIAVIGLGCRVPGARNPYEFWDNLVKGEDRVREIPEDRWKLEGFYSPDMNAANTSYSKWGGFLDSVTSFDPSFFKLSEEDLYAMDPQQLLSLEIAYETFEHAGYGAIKESGKDVGVFWGARGTQFTVGGLCEESRYVVKESNRNFILGRAQNMIAARIADFFNLKGPAIITDSACSSSLISIHLACQSIKCGECEMAIAGGVDLLVDPESYTGLSKAKAISPDGKCFTFDKKANGYVPGEGAGAVLLKRLDQALLDGDKIYGVILGSAANNDGRTMGITTPDLEGQKRVIKKALKTSGVDPSTISYVEAHGTGTTIGDPIEIKALTVSYREYTEKMAYCGIGSVKTNIGHLHCASGIAGFIKVILSLYNKVIPPTLNCSQPNPRFDLIGSPFYISAFPTEWEPIEGKRRAAISALGFGGTNCHVIIEEEHTSGEKSNGISESMRYQLFVLSAKEQKSLDLLVEEYERFLSDKKDIDLPSICHTVRAGREKFQYRISTVVSDREELQRKLKEYSKGQKSSNTGFYYGKKSKLLSNKVVFMFTGQGSLYPGVTEQLYRTSKVFRDTMDECSKYFMPYLKKTVTEYIYSGEDSGILQQTFVTQPVTFAVDYSLAKLWMSWGLKPSVVMGHSLGEYAAACIAGVLSLKEAAVLVALRGAVMQNLPKNGGMMAVFAGIQKVTQLIDMLDPESKANIAVASDNGPENVVLSGRDEALDRFLKLAVEQGIKYTKLQVSHAFHSPLMLPVLEDFKKIFIEKGIKPEKSAIGILSNVTGSLLGKNEVMDEEYWSRHILKPVLFRPCLEKLCNEGYRLFLEIGPTATLNSMAKQTVDKYEDAYSTATLQRNKPDWERIFDAAGNLFVRGVDIDFHSMDKEYGYNKTELPLYPFERIDFKKKAWDESPKTKDSVSDVCETRVNGVNLRHSEGECSTRKTKMVQNPYKKNIKKTSMLIDGCATCGELESTYYKVFNFTEDNIIRSHKVQGMPVLPGVCQWEMVAESAMKRFGWNACLLSDITHRTAVAGDAGEAKIVRIKIRNEIEKSFAVETLDNEEGHWRENTGGKLQSLDLSYLENIDIHQIKSNLKGSTVYRDEIYCLMENRGLLYSGVMKCVEEVTVKDNEAVALLKASISDADEESSGYIFHPGILDGALQAISVLLSEQNTDTYMPFYIKELKLFQSLPTVCFAYIRIIKASPNNEVIRADVKITDQSGNVLVEVCDFSLKRIDSHYIARNTKLDTDSTLNSLFYTLEWEERELVGKFAAEKGVTVALFDEDSSYQVNAVQSLEDKGHKLIKVAYGAGFAKICDHSYTVNQRNREDILQLVRAISGDKIEAIVYFCPFVRKDGRCLEQDVLAESHQKGLFSLMYLVQGMISRKLNNGIALLAVTANTQPVSGGTDVLMPEYATVLGMMKNISMEFDGIRCIHIDLDIRDSESCNFGECISNEILYNQQGELYTAYRMGHRYTRMIKRMKNSLHGSTEGINIRKNGTYIITGGLGGLGLEMGLWLSKKGAANIVLVARTKMPEQDRWDYIIHAQEDDSLDAVKEKILKIRQMQQNGSAVTVYNADVTMLPEMNHCISFIKGKFGSIHGVIHAAGVLSDSLIINMSEEKFNTVLGPKMLGTWILDKVTENEDMDFMILFSGLVSFVGIVGQSSHMSANCFEDSYGYYRTNVGKRKTLVINWGIWGGTGVVATPFYIETLKNMGFVPMETQDAVKAFEHVLAIGKTQVGIGHITDDKLRELINAELDRPKYGLDEETAFLNLLGNTEALKGRIFEKFNHREDVEFGEKLEKLCSIYSLEYFQGFGVFKNVDTHYTERQIMDICCIEEKFLLLVKSMLGMMEEEEFIVRNTDSYCLANNLLNLSPEDATAELNKEYTFAGTYTSLIRHCVLNYPQVLSGKLNPMNVLFPGGSSEKLEALYHIPSPYNYMTAKVIKEYTKTKKAGTKIRILEIGGGTGGTTVCILPEISGMDVEYVYTDISPVLVHKAKSRFDKYKFIRYEVLDIEKDPDIQGFHGREFDIVVAANVLHATKYLKNTFNHVKKLMNSDSLLVMLETTRKVRYADLIFGITDGWWKFEDTEFRKDSALLEHEEWETALMHLGFGRVKSLPIKNSQSARFPLSVIVAQPAATLRDPMKALTSEVEKEHSRDLSGLNPYDTVAEAKKYDIPECMSMEDHAAQIIAESVDDFICRTLLDKISGILGCSSCDIDQSAAFMEMGLDSLSLVSLTGTLEKEAGVKLYPTLFFEHQTVTEMTFYLLEKYGEEFFAVMKKSRDIHEGNTGKALMDKTSEQAAAVIEPIVYSDCKAPSFYSKPVYENREQYEVKNNDIAIIGMAGTFPKARNIDEFWNNLVKGIDCVSEISSDRWENKEYYDAKIPAKGKTYCKWAGLLDGIDLFDAQFFNISPKEAKRMDPQQRIFMEIALSAFENAGYGGSRLNNTKTGVFVGVSNHNYHGMSYDPNDNFSVLATSNAMVANRLSYFMNLNGPSMVVDTQCSSSMVALNYAIRSLLAGECTTALAGGVNIVIPPEYYVMLSQIKALSADGRCKAFDKGANGFVSGEGACALVLKPLKNALRDGDKVHAIIKGCAVNHDGRSNNLSAPNPNAQAAVIGDALMNAGVNPETVSYIEAHGTGTSLGDPVEISGLTRCFEKYTDRKSYCAIGSVKSNIGHLESGAGIAGIIKVAMAMKKRLLPPTIHFNQPNPNIDLTGTPFYINEKAGTWVSQNPLRAGVSSFGMGGTNAHVVLEEAPDFHRSGHHTANIFTISAKSQKTLAVYIESIVDHLDKNPGISLDDLCFTMNVGRGHYTSRAAIISKSTHELAEKLRLILRQNPGEVKNHEDGIFVKNLDPSVSKVAVKKSTIDEKISAAVLENKGAYHLVPVLCEAAEIYINGTSIVDWSAVHQVLGGFVTELPTYPFDRKSYWIEMAGRKEKSQKQAFEAFNKNGLSLKNRIVRSGIEIALASSDGKITNEYIDYCRRWISCGTSLYISGNFIVSEDGRMSDKEVVLTSQNQQTSMLKKLCREFQSDGSSFIIQLNHGGSMADQRLLKGSLMESSGVTEGGLNPASASQKEIVQVIENFVDAACIAYEAGADGVELHAGHGFLLSSFLSPKHNVRSDMWGGNLANRMRMVVEIVTGIRQRVGKGFLILIKLDIPAKIDVSMDEAVEMAQKLELAGVSILELSSGIEKANSITKDIRKRQLQQVLKLKEAVSLPVVFTGGIRKLDDINEILDSGAADLVGIARPLICEPDFVNAIRADDKKVSACSSCNICLVALSKGRLTCTRSKIQECAVDFDQFLYSPKWTLSPDKTPGIGGRECTWVVINPLGLKTDDIVKSLADQGMRVVNVSKSSSFIKSSKLDYLLDTSSETENEALIKSVYQDFGSSFGCIHLGGLDRMDEVQKDMCGILDDGVFSLLPLVKAINRVKEITSVKMIIPTLKAQRVKNEKVLYPENSLLTGLARVIPYEIKKIQVKTIDFDTSNTADIGFAILREADQFPYKAEEAAYRDHRRFEKEIVHANFGDVGLEPLEDAVKTSGVYVITGGTSGLGLLLAKHLADKKVETIVITGRRQLPDEGLYSSNKEIADGLDAEFLSVVEKIRQKGVNVVYRKLDVTDVQAVTSLFNELDGTYGRINGVIHCAGALDSVKRSLTTKTCESFTNVLKPKVHGVLALHKAIIERKLDFVILCSSIASINGRFGAALGDYAVANTFMDQYAQSMQENYPGRIISVNWSLWNGVGHGTRRPQSDEIFPIEPDQCLKMFDYILNSEFKGNIAVMDKRAWKSCSETVCEADSPVTRKSGTFNIKDTEKEKIHGQSLKKAEYKEVEEYIIGLLMEFLQLERGQIDNSGDFSDYGIDSVIVADMVGALEEKFGIMTHPSIIVEYSSAKSLARYLVDKLGVKVTCAVETEQGSRNDESSKMQQVHEVAKNMDNSDVGDEQRDEFYDVLRKLSHGEIDVKEAMRKFGGMV